MQEDDLDYSSVWDRSRSPREGNTGFIYICIYKKK